MTRLWQYLVCFYVDMLWPESIDAGAGVDILPLRPGHTLVIPKKHISRLSDLPPELAAAVGGAVSKVARALTEGECYSFMAERAGLMVVLATGNTGLNVVCNQEYAQAVPHVSASSIE